MSLCQSLPVRVTVLRDMCGFDDVCSRVVFREASEIVLLRVGVPCLQCVWGGQEVIWNPLAHANRVHDMEFVTKLFVLEFELRVHALDTFFFFAYARCMCTLQQIAGRAQAHCV